MSLKLKALGLGLLAILATSAFAVMNASAEPGGHFVSEVDHTTIVGTESGEKHRLHFTEHPSTPESPRIGCSEASYHGTANAATVESLTITPTYGGCTTTGTTTNVTVDVNGCSFTFTVTKGTTESTEQDVHLNCPTKPIEITHPNCNITVPSQEVQDAVTYTTTEVEGKHTITLDVNATFNTQYHEKICVFLGTPQEGTLTGSVTVEGFDTLGNRVGITAT